MHINNKALYCNKLSIDVHIYHATVDTQSAFTIYVFCELYYL